MKLGTDSVLIGAWAKADKAKKILDIGTGTGVIALMLAQRSKADIDAIDVEYAAHVQAKENFAASRWSKRLNSFHSSLQEFAPGKKYDLIVSNPPYVLSSEKEGLHKRVSAFEPPMALFVDDPDPIFFYRKITSLAKKILIPEGKIYFECHANYTLSVQQMLLLSGFKNVQIVQLYTFHIFEDRL